MFTREQFTEAMEKAVAERGEDFVYPDEWQNAYGFCQYYIEGIGAACLIGKALENLGFDVRSLENNGAITILEEVFKITDRGLIVAAQRAQTMQDWGQSWGDALMEYKDVLASSRYRRP